MMLIAMAIGIRTITRVSNCEVIDSSRPVCPYSVTAEAIRPSNRLTRTTATTLLPAPVRSVPALSEPVRLIPIARATKKTTIPTSARSELPAMATSPPCGPARPSHPDAPGPPSVLSVHRTEVGRQASDALDEPSQELVRPRFDGHVEVRRAAPDPAPVGDRFARRQ